MKNVDFKKLFILIGIIAIIAVAVFLIIKLGNKNKLTEEEEKAVINVSTEYYANLTRGYATPYGGLDVLYQRDSVTFKDLELEEIINTSIKYAEENSIDTTVSASQIKALTASKKYEDLSKYSLYSGTGVRAAIKALFGVEEYSDTSATNNYNYIYDYIYDSTNDVYLVQRNKVRDQINEAQSIDYKIVSTIAKDDKVTITMAIAYVYNDGTNNMYAKDPDGEKVIVKNSENFPEDKIDEFDKFEFTLKQTKDKKYVFESIKKVK